MWELLQPLNFLEENTANKMPYTEFSCNDPY